MAKTWTLSEIRDAVDPNKEYVSVEQEYAIVVELEPPHKIKMLFKKAGHRYVQLDLANAVEFVVGKLAPHVDIKTFLKELILLHSSVEEILELKERLGKGYVSVKEEPRCYSLMVGGKRGRPYEFNLVG